MDEEGGKKSSEEPKKPMTKEDAARIQGAEAKQHGGGVEEGSFAARAQAAADKRENKNTGNSAEPEKVDSQIKEEM